MKEWLIKMAKELGLPETATESEVLAKLSERFAALSGADKRLSALLSSAPSAGVKVEGDKLVKVEASTAPRNPDDVAKIAKLELDQAKARLAASKAEVENLIKSGKFKPAFKEKLDRIFSGGAMESIQLGKGENNSEVVIKGSIEILEDLRALFNEIPSQIGNKLSTVGGQPGDDNGKPVAGALGKAVAARNKPQQKKEPAAK